VQQIFNSLDCGRNTDEALQGSRKFQVEIYIPILNSPVNNLKKFGKVYEDV
jgi:hypothetical protein